jgi:hypothetical protein
METAYQEKILHAQPLLGHRVTPKDTPDRWTEGVFF